MRTMTIAQELEAIGLERFYLEMFLFIILDQLPLVNCHEIILMKMRLEIEIIYKTMK